MKFTLSWLKDHLDTNASLAQIVDRLNMVGLEVEQVDNPDQKLDIFTSCLVTDAKPHPNADTLKVCQVKTIHGDFQVVCGAPNARSGMKGIFAPPGSYIPGIDMTLRSTRIRGIKSDGMLLSEKEIGISDNHDQIIELADDSETGVRLTELLELKRDPMIEIAVTPNRGDCLGVRGIARDLASAGLGELNKADCPQIPGIFPSPVKIKLEFDDEDDRPCPVMAGRYIRGLSNQQSPKWLSERLEAIGLRPINALVDITNYLGYDLGRPLHVYDGAKLRGDVRARLGREGESFTALDAKNYQVNPDMCVIADDRGAIGLGGVIGGEDTGVDLATTEVFIESALFDPVRIARTSRAVKVYSDASQRFERNVDPASVLPGLALATKLVLEICGGDPSEPVIAGDLPDNDRIIDFPISEVKRLTGYDASLGEVRAVLKSLGFWLTGLPPVLKVAPPSFRGDIFDKADIVEEIIRILGVDLITSTPLTKTKPIELLSAAEHKRHSARQILAARGFIEAVTWSFISGDQARRFGGGSHELKLDNPLSSEMSDMRPSLFPGILAALARNNARGVKDQALCEIGQAFGGSYAKGQWWSACGVRFGNARPYANRPNWIDGAQNAGVFDIKGDVIALLQALGVPVDNLKTKTDGLPSWFHPGRSGFLVLGSSEPLAVFGELHPKCLIEFDLTPGLVGFEICFDNLPVRRKHKRNIRPPLIISDLPLVTRDFAFVISAGTSAEELLRAIRGAVRAKITEAVVFDVYQGEPLEPDERSLAVAVTFKPGDRTMTNEEIERLCAKIIGAVKNAVGGRLRIDST